MGMVSCHLDFTCCSSVRLAPGGNAFVTANKDAGLPGMQSQSLQNEILKSIFRRTVDYPYLLFFMMKRDFQMRTLSALPKHLSHFKSTRLLVKLK